MAGSSRDHILAASAPRMGSRFSSASVSSRPMARTSAPRSSGSISRRYTDLYFRSAGAIFFKPGQGEFILEVRRLFADFEPIEEGVGSFQPDREPVSDFFFLSALARVHFVVARNHFGAAAAEAGDFADAFRGGLLMFEQEFPEELVEAHQAHFSFLERGKMQQVREFFFVTTVGIGAGGPHHAQARFFEHTDDVIRRSFSGRAEVRDQLPANLFDFGGGIARLAETLRDFEDQRFLGGRSTFVMRV